MKPNMGKTDRVIRLLVGLIIVGIGVYFKSWWGAIGLVPISTAAIGWCGLYALLGTSTCKVQE